jgi:hypothetical protein
LSQFWQSVEVEMHGWQALDKWFAEHPAEMPL